MPATAPPLDRTVLTPAECARLGDWHRTHWLAVWLRPFTTPEQARLAFLRWLYSVGRVEP